MIKTTPKDISVHVDPISFTHSIKVLAGNPVQTYNNESGEYQPDRSLVPCLLMPYAHVYDPEGMMSGDCEVTSCQWFEGSPLADYSNLITADTAGYTIGKTDTPKWSLSVEKNYDADTPVDIHCIYTIVDRRKNTEVKLEDMISFHTAVYETRNYNLRVDCPDNFIIDPLADHSTFGESKWLHTITAQLYSGKDAVPDANVAYWWQVSEDGAEFRDFSDDELNLVASGKDETGNWTKSLTFDARMFRKASFRVRAAYYTDVYPSAPADDAMQKTVTVKIQMPKSLKVDIRQTAGAKVSASLNETVKFECLLTTNSGNVTATSLFKAVWMASSGKTGVADKKIAEGLTVSFKPSTLGFDKNYSMSVYCKVYAYAVHALVTSGGAAITNGGNYVTTKKFE